MKKILIFTTVSLALLGCQFKIDTHKPIEENEPILDCNAYIAHNKSEVDNSNITYSAWFEAEDAEHNLIVKTESDEGFVESTTNGDLLRMEKTSGLFLRWKELDVLSDGLTEFVIKGASPWGGKHQHLIIKSENGEIVHEQNVFDMYGTDDNPKQWEEYKVYADLPSGKYSLEIKDDWGYVFFDALRIRDQTVVRDSTINLNQINYYKALQNPVELNVNYNSNKLLGVVVDGNPIDYKFGQTCQHVLIPQSELVHLNDGEHELKIIFNQGSDSTVKLITQDNILKPTDGIYQAETQSVGADIEIIEDNSASNHAYVGNENFGSIEFIVLAPSRGQYEIKAKYKAPKSDSKRKLYINGKRMRTALGFRFSQDWDNSSSWILPLEQGANTIRLSPDYGYLALDYLQISAKPIAIKTEIHPKRNTVYIGQNLKPLKIKVDPINQNLISVMTKSGTKINYSKEEFITSVDGESISILEGGFWIVIPESELMKLGKGQHLLSLVFDDNTIQHFDLEILGSNETKVSPLTLTFFDVSHGLAVLMQLPDGKNIMVDAGKHDVNERRVRPFLIANKIPLDEIWTSHRHGDHYGGKEKLLEAYGDIFPENLKDNQSLEIWNDNGCTPSGETPFKRDDVIAHGDAIITIQNAHGDHCNNNYLDFNPNSLAFRLDYKGFRFGFQGDIYGQQQDENLSYHGEDAIRVDVLQSNHHWHGSISPEYIKKTDAELIVVSASEHVWGAGSFTQDGMEGVRYLRKNNPDFKERLMTFDSGHVVVKVFDDGTWTYETINTESIEYELDSDKPVVMGYSTSDLEQLKVGNFLGYRKEMRNFPIVVE